MFSDLAVELTLLYHQLERFEHILNRFVQLRARTLNIVDLVTFIRDLHLTQLRLDVELQ